MEGGKTSPIPRATSPWGFTWTMRLYLFGAGPDSGHSAGSGRVIYVPERAFARSVFLVLFFLRHHKINVSSTKSVNRPHYHSLQHWGLTPICPAASMATSCVAASPKPYLLAIPGEIRNEIYRMLLTTRYNFPRDVSRSSLSLYPSILRVNRQINQEATNVLHGDNLWITAQINVPEWAESGVVVPFISRKDPSHVKFPALHVEVDLPRETTAAGLTTLIMGVESLPFFLYRLRRSSSLRTSEHLRTADLTLRIYRSPFYSQQKINSKCLEPFTLVRGFGKYSVMSEPNTVSTWEYEEMISRASSPVKDVGLIKDITRHYLAQGDDECSLGNYIMAYYHYRIGSAFVKDAGASLFSYRRTQTQLSHTQQARNMFDIETAQGVLTAHYLRPLMAMRQHDLFKKAAGSSSAPGPRLLTKVELVGVDICKAIVYRRLGDREEARSSTVSACKRGVTKHEFVQVLLTVCPKPLREYMCVDDDFVARILMLKDAYDERNCEQKEGDESTAIELVPYHRFF